MKPPGLVKCGAITLQTEQQRDLSTPNLSTNTKMTLTIYLTPHLYPVNQPLHSQLPSVPKTSGILVNQLNSSPLALSHIPSISTDSKNTLKLETDTMQQLILLSHQNGNLSTSPLPQTSSTGTGTPPFHVLYSPQQRRLPVHTLVHNVEQPLIPLRLHFKS